MDPLFPTALQYIREVKSNIAAAGDGRQTYGEFLQTLKQYRKRNLHSSIVISTVQTLFRSHPNLLDGFKHFAPAAAAEENSGLEFLNRVRLRSCADFLNRVGARFDGGGAYRKFLERMHAYSRGEITAAAVSAEVAGIFGKNNGDLVREFARFLPESREQRQIKPLFGSRKRKMKIDGTDEQGMKRRRCPNSAAAPAPAPAPTTPPQRGKAKRGSDEEKAALRDNEMEDSLCEIDVKIGRLRSARRSAVNLHRSISDGGLPPAGICLDEHFTALDLVCIRNLGRKLPEYADHYHDLVPALAELMVALREKEVKLERDKEKIERKWKRVRQSQ